MHVYNYIYIYIYMCMNIHINICVYLCTYEYICVYTEVYSHGVRSHCNTLQHTATLVTPCKTRQHTAVSSHGTRSSYFGRERSGWNFSKVSSTVIFYSWLSSELSFFSKFQQCDNRMPHGKRGSRNSRDTARY